jgi:hypothetical protein
MVAAQKFNVLQKAPEPTVYGVVTTGVLWRFLKLSGTSASVDAVEYPIQSSRKVFGILTEIALGGTA